MLFLEQPPSLSGVKHTSLTKDPSLKSTTTPLKSGTIKPSKATTERPHMKVSYYCRYCGEHVRRVDHSACKRILRKQQQEADDRAKQKRKPLDPAPHGG